MVELESLTQNDLFWLSARRNFINVRTVVQAGPMFTVISWSPDVVTVAQIGVTTLTIFLPDSGQEIAQGVK